jgi:hypothetical protein
MPGSVASGTPCMCENLEQYLISLGEFEQRIMKRAEEVNNKSLVRHDNTSVQIQS